MNKSTVFLAPAKINRFLHIVGQRPDGYHLLETVFQMIDLCDEISIELRDDGVITRQAGLDTVPEDRDLMIRAAKLLQSHTQTALGCNLSIKKVIPMGAGLGGGSSDAATVLIALNQLWRTNLNREKLADLGLQLGADVPFFIFGKNAFAQGIGEKLQEIKLEKSCFLLIYPQVHIATSEIFSDRNLTRNHPKVTISDLSERAHLPEFGNNDCEKVAVQRHPEVARAIEWLKTKAPNTYPKMSGSGSTVFAQMAPELANQLLAQLPDQWIGFVCWSVEQHPAYNTVL